MVDQHSDDEITVLMNNAARQPVRCGAMLAQLHTLMFKAKQFANAALQPSFEFETPGAAPVNETAQHSRAQPMLPFPEFDDLPQAGDSINESDPMNSRDSRSTFADGFDLHAVKASEFTSLPTDESLESFISGLLENEFGL